MKIIERKIGVATSLTPSSLEKLEAMARKNHLNLSTQIREVLENFITQNTAGQKPVRKGTTSRGKISIESLPKTFNEIGGILHLK